MTRAEAIEDALRKAIVFHNSPRDWLGHARAALALPPDAPDRSAADMLRALQAVAVALDCNTSQGGDLEKRLYKANPETLQAIHAAIVRATGREG